LGQGVLSATVGHVEAVREMNQKDRAQHNGNEACRPEAEQNASQDGQSTRYLCQSHQVCQDDRPMMVGGKLLRSGAAEGSKQNAATVIKECHRAANSKDKKGSAHPRR
jgi:hypothetical protein